MLITKMCFILAKELEFLIHIQDSKDR